MKNNRIVGIICLVILTAGLVFYNNIKLNTVTPIYIDGSYINFSQTESNGYYSLAQVIVENGTITQVQIDAMSTDGVLKSDLSKSGDYIMTEDGPLIHEQYEDIANFIVQTGSTDGIIMDENGKTDVISSASISVSPYVTLVSEILDFINIENTTTTIIKAEEPTNGYYPQVTITHNDKMILALEIDSIGEDGTSKITLSQTGQYVMTENGPLWHEQINDLENYVITYQSTSGLNLDSDGKTDVISSASISLSPYVVLIDEFLNS